LQLGLDNDNTQINDKIQCKRQTYSAAYTDWSIVN